MILVCFKGIKIYYKNNRYKKILKTALRKGIGEIINK